MTTQLRPIETIYQGVKFRSRLEARWAVFFTEAGIRWEYEPEAFQTDHGPYLPDFLLYNVNGGKLWAEVKPSNWLKQATDSDQARFLDVAEGTGIGVALLTGGPGLYSNGWHTSSLSAYTRNRSGDFYGVMYQWNGSDSPYEFCSCTWCDAPGFEFAGYSDRVHSNCLQFPADYIGNSKGDNVSDQILRAIEAAWTHRFWEPSR